MEEILFTFTRIGGAPNAFSQITVSCGGRATLQLSDRQLMVWGNLPLRGMSTAPPGGPRSSPERGPAHGQQGEKGGAVS